MKDIVTASLEAGLLRSAETSAEVGTATASSVNPVSVTGAFLKPIAVAVLAAAAGRDVGAFTDIVRQRQSRVRQFMRRLCRHPDLADDLAQQVFLKLWRSLGQLRNPAAFDGWLKQLMITVWLDQVRRPQVPLDDLVYLDVVPEKDGYHDTTAERLDLDAALARLPAAVRLCVILSFNDGHTHPEIVNLTGLPLGTVKSHINRGTNTLRRLLAAYGGK